MAASAPAPSGHGVPPMQVMDRIARYSHSVASDTLGSFLNVRGSSLPPDAPVQHAAGLMLANGCSYIPVMTGSSLLGWVHVRVVRAWGQGVGGRAHGVPQGAQYRTMVCATSVSACQPRAYACTKLVSLVQRAVIGPLVLQQHTPSSPPGADGCRVSCVCHACGTTPRRAQGGVELGRC